MSCVTVTPTPPGARRAHPSWRRAPAPGSTIERLRTELPDRLNGWLITITITVVALLLRLHNLGSPHDVLFDETFYPKDAWSLLQHGHERAWPDSANDSILAGNPDVMTGDAAFIVHPPVGKWLIALGEAMFGMTPFGWRVAAAVVGSLLVFMVIRLTRRLSGSNLVAGIAGVLLTVDGLAFVMSRLGLLDIFLSFFLVAAVAALAADRDWARNRLADHLTHHGLTDLDGRFGPLLWWRPWRLVAGVMFAGALGTKWSALYVLAAFSLLSLAWDVGMRRLAGSEVPVVLRTLRDGVPAFIQLVVVAVVGYIVSWSGWFATSGGWKRDWAATHPQDNWAPGWPNWLISWLEYHREMYAFHTGDYIAQQTHPYQSHPGTWLLALRPVGIEARTDIAAGTEGCPPGGENCYSIITALGTPVLWWAAVVALAVAVVLWILRRDWRFAVPVLGVASTWLPWFQYTDRPIFYFYAVCIIPFSVIALAMVLGMALGDAAPTRQRRFAAIGVGVLVALVVLNFAYFHPIYTGEVITHTAWLDRMWLKSWI